MAFKLELRPDYLSFNHRPSDLRKTKNAEWRQGLSPHRSHRTVREPLDSYGSSYSILRLSLSNHHKFKTHYGCTNFQCTKLWKLVVILFRNSQSSHLCLLIITQLNMLSPWLLHGFPCYHHYYGLVRPLHLSSSFAVCVLLRFGRAM